VPKTEIKFQKIAQLKLDSDFQEFHRIPCYATRILSRFYGFLKIEFQFWAWLIEKKKKENITKKKKKKKG
jgi:hypothetical protein